MHWRYYYYLIIQHKWLSSFNIYCIKYTLRLSGLENGPQAISAFHVYSHQSACQVQFNSKLVIQISLVDREDCARRWSILSHHNIATWYITEYNHHLFLTLLISYYHEQKLESLGNKIWNRLCNNATIIYGNTYIFHLSLIGYTIYKNCKNQKAYWQLQILSLKEHTLMNWLKNGNISKVKSLSWKIEERLMKRRSYELQFLYMVLSMELFYA